MRLEKVPHKTTIEWLPYPASCRLPHWASYLVLTERGNVFEATHINGEWKILDESYGYVGFLVDIIAYADQDNLTHHMNPEPPAKPTEEGG